RRRRGTPCTRPAVAWRSAARRRAVRRTGNLPDRAETSARLRAPARSVLRDEPQRLILLVVECPCRSVDECDDHLTPCQGAGEVGFGTLPRAQATGNAVAFGALRGDEEGDPSRRERRR